MPNTQIHKYTKQLFCENRLVFNKVFCLENKYTKQPDCSEVSQTQLNKYNKCQADYAAVKEHTGICLQKAKIQLKAPQIMKAGIALPSGMLAQAALAFLATLGITYFATKTPPQDLNSYNYFDKYNNPVEPSFISQILAEKQASLPVQTFPAHVVKTPSVSGIGQGLQPYKNTGTTFEAPYVGKTTPDGISPDGRFKSPVSREFVPPVIQQTLVVFIGGLGDVTIEASDYTAHIREKGLLKKWTAGELEKEYTYICETYEFSNFLRDLEKGFLQQIGPFLVRTTDSPKRKPVVYTLKDVYSNGKLVAKKGDLLFGRVSNEAGKQVLRAEKIRPLNRRLFERGIENSKEAFPNAIKNLRNYENSVK